MDREKFDGDLVVLDNIVIANASIDNEKLLSKIDNEKSLISIDYEFETGANIEFKKIRVIFNCKITHEEIRGKFNIAFFFTIENFDEVIQAADKDLIINGDLHTMLANIAYSTSRGIIFTRCQGTVLSNFILPIQSNKQIDQKIELSNSADA